MGANNNRDKLVTTPDYPIRTKRLALRPFETRDADAVLAYHSLPEVSQYQFWSPRSRPEVEVKVAAWGKQHSIAQEGDAVVLAVVLAGSSQLIGDIMLSLNSGEARQGEIGYSFNPDYSGQGYATEAVGALVDWGFDALGLHRILARCDARNERSWKLVERMNFRREAHFREHAKFKGGWDEEYYYAILNREWADLQSTR